jgi:hypothetical protein
MIRLLQEWVLTPTSRMEIITIPLEGDLAHKDSGKYRNHQKWRCAGHERWNQVKRRIQSNDDQRTKLFANLGFKQTK